MPRASGVKVLAQGWLDLTRGWWRQDPKLSGGGQLYDSSAHVLSTMMYLVDSPVVEAFCYTDNKGAPVDINAVGCIRFANGCMATITSGGNCNTWKSLLIVQAKQAGPGKNIFKSECRLPEDAAL